MPIMRMLFCAAGGHGHLQPLLPLAERALARGHEVAISAAPALQRHVQDRGFRFQASGPDLVSIRAPLTVHGLEHERGAIGRHFIGQLAPARARDLIDLGGSWSADLIVCDEADYGAAVAAEVLNIPHATVVVQGAGGFARRQDVEAPLTVLRTSFGRGPEDAAAERQPAVLLNPFPPSFRDPHDPLRGRVVAYQLDAPQRAAWPDQIRVYVTLGTVFNTESGDLLSRIVRAVATVDVVGEVVVATGEHVDPAELGPLPGHVVARRFVAQRGVLAGCTAVVSHAGSGTVLDAMACGLPMVCLPLGADQSLNARRCAELGFGVTLAAETVTDAEIAQVVRQVVSASRYRRSAALLRSELSRLPSLDAVMAELESLCS